MNKHEDYGRKNKREDAIEDGRELINVTQKEVDDWILSGEEYKPQLLLLGNTFTSRAFSISATFLGTSVMTFLSPSLSM